MLDKKGFGVRVFAQKRLWSDTACGLLATSGIQPACSE
jgi:hypothetical protein